MDYLSPELLPELAVAVILRVLSPSPSTQPQVLADRAYAVLANLEHGGASAVTRSAWEDIMDGLHTWALKGIPVEARASAESFGTELAKASGNPAGAALVTAMARAFMLAAVLVDPLYLDILVVDTMVRMKMAD
jgi:hypothetical protein